MIRPIPLRRTLLLIGVATAVATSLVIAVLAGRAHLAWHLGKDLNQLPEAEVPLRMQQLVELGEPGMAVLAEALGSTQTTVARAAETALLEQLDRWKTMPVDVSSPKVAHLIRQLAIRSLQYGPRARAAAAGLATRALDWQNGGSSVDRAQLISDCAAILRAAGTDRLLTQPDELSGVFVESPQPSPPPCPSDELPAFRAKGLTPSDGTDSPAGRSAFLPGDDAPLDVAAGPSHPAAPQYDSVARPTEIPSKSPSETRKEDSRAPFDKPPARLDPPLSRPVPWDPRRAMPAASPTARRTNAEQPAQTVELSLQDDLSLMRRLHALHPEQSRAARSELVRRGFDARQLRMAEDLTNPDRNVRIRLARALPVICDVDVRPWLKTLANDEDAQVRLAAIAVIATLGAPESRSWLRRLLVTEQDPYVQQHLQQILKKL
jgi:hypothetical protein